MEDALHTFAEWLALGVNLVAMLAVAFGAAQATYGLVWAMSHSATENQLRQIWLNFARWLVAGLTFQLAADIVETTIAPTWDEVGKLAAIAVIRTFLNYFLDRDMEKIRERSTESG